MGRWTMYSNFQEPWHLWQLIWSRRSKMEAPWKLNTVILMACTQGVQHGRLWQAGCTIPHQGNIFTLQLWNVKEKTTEVIATFWKLFNEVLQELKNEANYKFNPIGFSTDEGGASMNGLLQVFGQQVIHKIKTCQFHFRQCLRKSAWKNSWRTWRDQNWLSRPGGISFECCYFGRVHTNQN